MTSLYRRMKKNGTVTAECDSMLDVQREGPCTELPCAYVVKGQGVC